MVTSILCVYNLARRVFLSSKVTVADAVNQPLKVLKDLVAMDAESGLWLTPLPVRPNLPKLFPYDLAYLDKDLRVLEMIEVLPGIDFPAQSREVASAIVLPPDTLRTTQTRVGDPLLVGSKEEVAARLAGVGPAAHDPSDETASVEQAATACEDGSGGLPASAVLTRNSPLPRPAAPTMSTSIENEAKSTEEPPAGLKPRPKTSGVSITEVIIERPHEPSPQVQQNVEHRPGLEDLFANWVDSPAAPPSWIAQKAREHELEGASTTENSASDKKRKGVNQEIGAIAAGTASGSDSKEPVEPAPPPSPAERAAEPPQSPAPVSRATTQIPQKPQTNTFTIGQYGIWQLSTPTVGSPKRSASNGTGQSSSKSAAGAKRAENSKPESQTAARKAGDARVPLSAKPRQTSESTPPAETAAKTTPPEKSPPGQREPKKPTMTEASVTLPMDVAPPQVDLAEAKAARESVRRETEAPPHSGAKPMEGTIESGSRNEKVSEPAKPTMADFTATLQQRFEKLQTLAAQTGDSPKAEPVSKKEIFAAANSRPVSEMSPGPPTIPSIVPDKPATKPENGKDATQPLQQEHAVPLPPPRFLKSNPDQPEKLKIPIQRVDPKGKNLSQSQAGFGARLKRWLKPAPSTKSDRRRAHRRYVPGMVAHYYTGGAPKPHEIADISMSGIYLLTDDRWVPDTMIRMTLQKPCAKGERKQSITVLSRIVRRGSDGVGAEFVMQESLDPNSRDILPSHATDKFSLARFL